jgi:hypothetical protein
MRRSLVARERCVLFLFGLKLKPISRERATTFRHGLGLVDREHAEAVELGVAGYCWGAVAKQKPRRDRAGQADHEMFLFIVFSSSPSLLSVR